MDCESEERAITRLPPCTGAPPLPVPPFDPLLELDEPPQPAPARSADAVRRSAAAAASPRRGRGVRGVGRPAWANAVRLLIWHSSITTRDGAGVPNGAPSGAIRRQFGIRYYQRSPWMGGKRPIPDPRR